jgi:hypothetical protein
MVALEHDEPLLLFMSMVLVAERPEPKQPQALKGALAVGFGSKDPDPAEGPRDQEAFGSQLPEPTLSPEPQIGSRLSKEPSGLED